MHLSLFVTLGPAGRVPYCRSYGCNRAQGWEGAGGIMFTWVPRDQVSSRHGLWLIGGSKLVLVLLTTRRFKLADIVSDHGLG